MGYRAIDVSAETRRALPHQPAPMLQWVKIGDLVVDEEYQRALTRASWAAIRRIAGAFDWSHFGALAVAPVEGGRFALIDGQHRAHAAAICGVEEVPVIVSVLPPSAQARAFAVMNSTGIKVSPLQVYKAALASGEAWAVACREAVTAAGCRLMTGNFSSAERKVGQVFCVQLVRELVTRGRSDVVRIGLGAIRAHAAEYPSGRAVDLFANAVLRPWLTALEADRALLDVDLAGFLAHVDLFRVIDGAKVLHDSPDYRKTPLAVLKRNAIVVRIKHHAGKLVAA
jgi:hypothetical protein